MLFEQGPYIQAACICEMVLEDKGGALSMIRVIDTITHAAPNHEHPGEMPHFTYNLRMVIMLKSGKARGRYEMKIVPELPSGELKQPFSRYVQMEGEERGCNNIINMGFPFTMEGLHLFNVYFDNALLTRIPFRVRYEPNANT